TCGRVFEEEIILLAGTVLGISSNIDIIVKVNTNGCSRVIAVRRAIEGLLPDDVASVLAATGAGTGCSAVLDGVDIEVDAVPDCPGNNDVIIGVHCHVVALVGPACLVVKSAPEHPAAVSLELDRVEVIVGATGNGKIPEAGNNDIPLGIICRSDRLLLAGLRIRTLPDDVTAAGKGLSS